MEACFVMTTEELQESRQRLDQQVKELQQRIDAGQKKPLEKVDRIPHIENVVSVADVMSGVIDTFKNLEEESKGFRKKLDDFLKDKGMDCDVHKCAIPIDRNSSFSKSWFDEDKQFHVIFGQCPKCMKEVNDQFVNESWKKKGVPENLLNATIGNYVTGSNEGKIKAINKAKLRIDKKKGFMILRGSYGTGKSHIAVGTLKIFDGLMITEADLIGELRQTYSDNSGQDKMVDKYRKAPCLVLDELDKNIKGVDIPGLLYRILGYRYDNSLITVITSNDSLDEIKEVLGGKLVDRMKEDYSVITFDWESHRHG